MRSIDIRSVNMSEIAELKTLIQGMQAELERTAKNATIEELIRKIDEKDVKIADLTRRVKSLEGRIPTPCYCRSMTTSSRTLVARTCASLGSLNPKKAEKTVQFASRR